MCVVGGQGRIRSLTHLRRDRDFEKDGRLTRSPDTVIQQLIPLSALLPSMQWFSPSAGLFG